MAALSSTTQSNILKHLEPYMNLKKALEDALKGNIEMVKELINFGVDVKDGSALVVAARHAREGTASLDIMELLLQSGADVNGRSDELTPLQVLLSRRHDANCPCYPITQLLLAWGGNEESGSYSDQTSDLPPFLLAAENGHTGALRLLKGKQSLNYKDSNGRSAFILAASGEAIECLKMLLLDFDINDVDENSWTALHWAVDRENVEIMTWLLNNGANPEAKDDQGTAALDGYEYLLSPYEETSQTAICPAVEQGPQKVVGELVSWRIFELLKNCGMEIARLRLKASTKAELMRECSVLGLQDDGLPKLHSDLEEKVMQHFKRQKSGSYFIQVVEDVY